MRMISVSRVTPALLTRISTRPSCARVASTIWVTEAELATSSIRPMAGCWLWSGDLAGGALGFHQVAVGDDHAGAQAGKIFGDGAPDTAPPTGDNRYFAFKIHRLCLHIANRSGLVSEALKLYRSLFSESRAGRANPRSMG